MKTCKKCSRDKEFSEFHKSKRSKDGHQGYCKSCNNSAVRDWQADNPEKFEANWRKHSYGNPRRRATKYGLTVEQLERLLEDAGGICTICKQPPHHYLVVDHCHTSNIVRGILCEKCNQALGLMRDNTDYLKNAIDYLLKFQTRIATPS